MLPEMAGPRRGSISEDCERPEEEEEGSSPRKSFRGLIAGVRDAVSYGAWAAIFRDLSGESERDQRARHKKMADGVLIS